MKRKIKKINQFAFLVKYQKPKRSTNDPSPQRKEISHLPLRERKSKMLKNKKYLFQKGTEHNTSHPGHPVPND